MLLLNRCFGGTGCNQISAGIAGKDKETMRKDIGRNRYFTPAQAIEYGLIDDIVKIDRDLFVKKDYAAALKQQQAQEAQQQRMPVGAGAGAESGY